MRRLDEQQRALVEDNLKLVYFVLKKMGISRADKNFDDFFGAGCVGLCKAARTFKEDGSAFSTFAFHIIKHEVLNLRISLNRDKARLVSFERLYDSIPAPDCGFDELEFNMMTEGFWHGAGKNLGETAATLRLLALGESREQVAALRKISLSAVDKAKKRARAALTAWLSEREC